MNIMQQLFNRINKYLSPLSLKFIILVVAFNIGSCNCDTEKTTKKPDENKNDFQRRDDKSIELALTAAGKTSIQGKELIQLKIVNDGSLSTIGGPKLQITRTAGSHASIQDAMDKGNGQYEVASNEILAKNSITKDLTIVPGADIEASFEFQLIYKGQSVGNKVTINWKKGIAVELKDVKYDKDTGYITYSLVNSGSEPVQRVKLQYTSKTGGIQVGGKPVVKDQEISVDVDLADSLELGKERKNLQLAKLDFGTNAEADFEFTVVCEGGASISSSCTLTAIEIKLELALTYDESKRELTYVIKNTGNDIAKAVQLIYNNVSSDVGEASVLLAGKQKGETAAQDLAPKTGRVTNTIAVDFNTQTKALFELKVVCNGITLGHLTKTEELKAPQLQTPQLELMNDRYSTAEIKLEDPKKEANIIIENQPKSGKVQLDQPVELQITRTNGKSGYLSQDTGIGKECKVITQKIEGIHTKLALYVKPETDDELKFELQLFYNKQPMGVPLIVSWKAEEVSLNLNWVDPKPDTLTPKFIELAKDKRAIKVKIDKGVTSGLVDPSQLKLQLVKNDGSHATLSTTQGGTEVTELIGSQLGNIGDAINLFFDPKTDTSLTLKLALFYKGKLQGTPLRLDWGNTELTNFLEALQEQVISLLQQEELEEAELRFENAITCYNSKATPGHQKIVENIYEQIVQKLETKVQAYSNNTDNLYNLSKAIKLADVAKQLSTGKQSFIKIDRLQAIAKKAYIAALDILDKGLASSLAASSAAGMLENAKKLAAVPKEYGLDASRVEKVNKAAYAAVVQTQLGLAKEQEDAVSSSASSSSKTHYAKESLEAANRAAEVAKEAEKNNFGDVENVKAVQQAYIAAAQAELNVAKYKQQRAKDFPSSAQSDVQEALQAANRTANVAKQAEKNKFVSTELIQTVQQAYIAAAQAELNVAKYKQQQPKGFTSSYSAQSDLQEALQAASRTANVAKQAEKNQFGSTELIQTVQQVYAAAAQAELHIAKDKEKMIGKTSSISYLDSEYAEEALEAAQRAASVVKAAKGFESPELHQAVKQAYQAALAAYKALKDDAKYKKIMQGIEWVLKKP